MFKFFSNFRRFQHVAIVIWVATGGLGAVLFLLSVKSLTDYQLGSLILMCFFLAATIITGVIDLKKGIERRIEISMIFFLVSLIFLVLSFVVEDLIKANSLEITRTLAAILAGAIALFGLTIAYLNYKRKSGVVVECSIYQRFSSIETEQLDIYFTNLKDRAVVIYDYTIDIKNVEIRRFLEKPIVLAAYGAVVDNFDCSLFFYKQAVYDPNEKHILHTNFIQTALDIDFSDRVKQAGSDFPSDLLLHPLIYDIINGIGTIRARTNHGIKTFKTKKEELLRKEKEVVLYPVTALDLEVEMKRMRAHFPKHYKEVVSNLDDIRKDNKISHREKQRFIEFSEDALRKKGNSYEVNDLGFGTRVEKEKRKE